MQLYSSYVFYLDICSIWYCDIILNIVNRIVILEECDITTYVVCSTTVKNPFRCFRNI